MATITHHFRTHVQGDGNEMWVDLPVGPECETDWQSVATDLARRGLVMVDEVPEFIAVEGHPIAAACAVLRYQVISLN